MKTLLKVMEVIYDGVVNKDYDEVLCITGGEGVGKTNVELTLVDWWLRKRYGEVTESMARKHIALDSKDFAKVLGKAQRFDPAAHDEAADLSARGAMQKQNRLYVEAYQIIRGDNLFTILVIPSIFDLDSFFRKRRVRHLIHVYARGRLAFWSNNRLTRMVQLNERLPYKNVMLTKPTFYDTCPLYKGALKKEYDAMKQEKMKEVRKRLEIAMKSLGAGDNLVKSHAKVIDMKKEGKTSKEIAEATGYNKRYVSQIVRQYT